MLPLDLLGARRAGLSALLVAGLGLGVVLAAQVGPVTLLIVRSVLRGGRALAVGVQAAKGDEILLTDADLSTPIEELEKLQAALSAGAGAAIGSRALRGSRVEISQPLYRVLMGKVFNLIVQAVLLPGIWDTQCGFKLFRADVAHRVFTDLITDGFGFDPEVLYRARKQGVRIVEVPVVWRNSSPTKVSAVRSSLDMLKHVIRLRFSL